jgi:ATP-dependent DNA helicase RecG
MKTPLSELGVTPKKEKQFNRKDIESVEDLLDFFPINYRNYQKLSSFSELEEDTYAAIKGLVVDKESPNSKMFSVFIEDEYKRQFRVNWFGGDYYFNRIQLGEKYIFCGKITSFRNFFCMNSPEFFTKNIKELSIYPRYSKIRGMSRDYLVDKIEKALTYPIDFNEDESQIKLVEKFKLMPKRQAYKELHKPSSAKTYKHAKLRFAFDVVYDFYKGIKQRSSVSKFNPPNISSFKIGDKFIDNLPFVLTKDQLSTIENLKNKMISKEKIQGLVLGDVGSGKTVVAAYLCAIMAENGYQTALLNPTQVLANQNCEVVKEYLEPFGYKVELLTSSTRVKKRREILAKLNNGEIDVLVGTHSLINEKVVFKNIGLSLIDEEHRFGVKQKEKLRKNYQENIHSVSMSATPIPRSLALSIFGKNIDVYNIKTKPKGRKAVETKQVYKIEKIYEKIKEEINKGRQAYIVCPLIEESESEAFKKVLSVNKVYEEINKKFKHDSDINICKISGDMKDKKIDKILTDFSNEKYQVLISTTIIEVGINVPNASLMAICSAERFGLSQLHQLRGRVGRASYDSYCLLMSHHKNERLKTLETTTDGFKIAEKDLELRGGGSLTGLVQTGYSEEIESIMKYPKLAKAVREEIFS